MKIAFLHYTCGLIDRGSEISTQILASYFASKNHKVSLYQLGNSSKKENYQVSQIRVPLKPRLKKNLSLIGKILERLYLDYNSLLVLFFSFLASLKLLKEKPEIIIATNGFWQVLICKLIKVFINTKIVVIGRAGIGWHDQDNLRLSPDLFIGLSEKAVSWAKKINPKVKSLCLPNAIDIELFLKKRKPVNLGLKSPIILSVAALTPYKRLDKLILACSELKSVSLLIVGQGELYNQLNQLGRKYLKDRFLIKSFKNKAMVSVYKACDLFVLLSEEREAFGRVFLEAMACNLPVVTIDDQARRNIIGKNGLFVKSLDQKSLAKILEKALKLKRGKQSKIQAKRYDIRKVGSQYEKAFWKLLKS